MREITGAPAVNTTSVCLGGTLTAIALAHNAANGDSSVNSATLLNTHTDFSQPGLLGAFTDEATVAGLEKRMLKKGYLDGAEMAHTFDALRANDLVFSYVVNNWLLGKTPPAFDLLVWNKDNTRMPAKMHSQYLRSCYLNNEFARGEFVIDGRTLDPGKVDTDTYVLAAVDDHIVPWVSGYRTTQLLGGDNRFVLSTSGHIAGIINPPSPKSKHWTNENYPADAEDWKAGAELHDESWWEDWARWIERRSGPMVLPPNAPGSDAFRPLEDAPGSYVRVRV
jgi:polyhydroxyalkanoate synthase subunit PhaC